MNYKWILWFVLFSLMFVKTKAQPIELRIMSFNVQQPYGTNWDARKDSVSETILQQNPDIIGTQEAINSQRDYLLKQNQKYNWYGIGRDGGDNGEGSWIFYKKDKFRVDSLKSGNFWLSETPNEPSRFEGDYNRICTYVCLIDKSTQRSFYVFNAHFPIPELNLSRMRSMRFLTQQIAAICNNDLPLLLTGDFNSPEEDAATIYMQSGNDNPVKFKDTYRDVHPEGFVTTGFNTKYDYIYYKNAPGYKTLKAWVVKEPLGASDHFAIMAEISIE